MRTTAIILLITFIPAFCFANGKIAAIKKGQRAPFSGILLDKSAEATMAAKRAYETQERRSKKIRRSC